MGELIGLLDPATREPLEGYYCGAASPQISVVVCKTAASKWRLIRVHPARITRRKTQREPTVGGDPMKPLPPKGRDIEAHADSEGDYDLIDGDEYEAPERKDGAVGFEEKVDLQSERSEAADDIEVRVEVGGDGSDYDTEDVGVGGELLADGSGNENDAKQNKAKSSEALYVFVDGGWKPETELYSYASLSLPQTPHKIPKPHDNTAKNQIAASKEEVAAGSHKAADLKELRSFHQNGALGARIFEITPQVKRYTMTGGWRRTWKGEGGARVAKSRLYVRGFQDKREKEWLKTYSSTMDKGLFRILLIYVLMRGWSLAKTDVSTAFLQARSPDILFIKLPSDLPEEAVTMGYVPGGIYKQEKAIYGRVDAPRLFTTQFKAALAANGWIEIAPAILAKLVQNQIEGVMGTHVDDLICGAARPMPELDAIGKLYRIDQVHEIKPNVYEVYAGMDILFGKDKCLLGQHRYAADIQTELDDADRLSRRQFTERDLDITPDGEANIIYKEAQQGWVGILGWLAQT